MISWVTLALAIIATTELAPRTATASAVATLDGRSIDPFAGDARATVLIFIHPDCPVSNRYAPELNRLHEDYAARDVRLFAVYPGRDDDESTIRAHYAEYGLTMTALRDPDFRLADMAGATMTPEAAVFVAGALVYRGRIDDRAPRIGVWRPLPRVRDLANVLERIEGGEAVKFLTTQAVGCYIKPLS
jgi:thiol-disulfide isomerase/thioredoxin